MFRVSLWFLGYYLSSWILDYCRGAGSAWSADKRRIVKAPQKRAKYEGRRHFCEGNHHMGFFGFRRKLLRTLLLVKKIVLHAFSFKENTEARSLMWTAMWRQPQKMWRQRTYCTVGLVDYSILRSVRFAQFSLKP